MILKPSSTPLLCFCVGDGSAFAVMTSLSMFLFLHPFFFFFSFFFFPFVFFQFFSIICYFSEATLSSPFSSLTLFSLFFYSLSSLPYSKHLFFLVDSSRVNFLESILLGHTIPTLCPLLYPLHLYPPFLVSLPFHRYYRYYLF